METREIILARYKTVEREADALGRVFGVHRLKPADKIKIREMAVIADPNVLGTLMVAAAVCEIDSVPVPFPKSRGELDSRINMLDEEGMVAATTAYIRVEGLKVDGEDQEDVIDAAKKSVKTQTTDNPSSPSATA
jgi:hypothetical protein